MEKNYKEILDSIVNNLGNYLNENNLKSMVLGISGGIDSTLCAYICHLVSKKYNINFFGISLPSNTNMNSEVDSATDTMYAFCDNYYEKEIDSLYNLHKYWFDEILDVFNLNETPISEGNVKARIRMQILYKISGLTNGIVIDTDNLTEHYLGFFTVHGDVGDYKPIGHLWKHEIFELTKYIYENCELNTLQKNALITAYNAIPTDGNGTSNSGDMGQIAPGFDYYDVDYVLDSYINKKYDYSNLYNKYNNIDVKEIHNKKQMIIDRYNKNKFKHKY